MTAVHFSDSYVHGNENCMAELQIYSIKNIHLQEFWRRMPLMPLEILLPRCQEVSQIGRKRPFLLQEPRDRFTLALSTYLGKIS